MSLLDPRAALEYSWHLPRLADKAERLAKEEVALGNDAAADRLFEAAESAQRFFYALMAVA